MKNKSEKKIKRAKNAKIKEFNNTIKNLYIGMGAEVFGIVLMPYAPDNFTTAACVTTAISGTILGGFCIYSLRKQYEDSLEKNNNKSKKLIKINSKK